MPLHGTAGTHPSATTGAAGGLRTPAGAAHLDLPADLPRADRRDRRPATEELALPAGTGARLRPSEDHRPAAFALAALCAVLHRHTGQDDFLLAAALPATGPDPVLLRARFDPRAPFTALWDHLHEDTAGRADAPVGRQAEEAAEVPAVAFRYLTADDGTRDGPGGAPYDLAFTLDTTRTPMVLRLGYDAGLHERETAARLLRHTRTLLDAAGDEPGRPVAELPVGDGAVAAPRPWALPAPAGHLPPPAAGVTEGLVHRFKAVAAAHGDRPALRGPSGELRYADLDRITDTMAPRLPRPPAEEGTGRVALLCAHDTGAVLGVWSALKAGAAYVPLDPRLDDTRLAAILADAGADALLCDAALAGRAAALAPALPVVPLPTSYDAVERTGREVAAPTADAMAYVLYTSGTTGTPKGVVQTHGNVLRHALTYAARLRLGPGERVPLLARYSFDAGVMDLFGALLTGACLEVVDPSAHSPASLRAALADAGATVVHCTPTVFRHLTSAGHGDGALDTVRVVVLGGEEATGADAAAFRAAFPAHSRLVNGLGPTECTLALQHLVEPADALRAALPVGRPVEGVEVLLTDTTGRPTEVFGELVLRGARVARGYWRDPERTAAAFTTDADGTPSYRTGDLARRLPDGNLVFCGRRDQRVKIRGQWADPAEVEKLLRVHPTVGQAAVVVDRHPLHGTRLLGYVTSPTFLPPDENELLGYLGRQLPDHAVPARVVVLDSLPVGLTGKLDRSRLPAPAEPAPGQETPRTATEEAVSRIWCEVIGLASVGLREHFVGTGGDSMHLMEMLGRIGDELGADIMPGDFLASPTVETLARLVDDDLAAS
ncbi:amino acid adenylation domain-containing protein [Streptomyces sp. HU2014]|uniref:amino acid adenylation domain-containing protein n=1 Tax=Streptomyces sp. HU2014 TaxID=2939414 RepID=UPI00200EEDC9|nr:amino acid adenylation domain-containing protein [Streptomyces sp. HU2014]UQI46111.1 amino acid adenylation domain-containing protein [Streptomyces sp. HU2014]